MERDYTKEELQKKNVLELKNILKNKQLKSSGKKEDLIERILNDQPKFSEPANLKGNTYFDILPSDIINLLNNYRAENNPNNKIVFKLLDNLDLRVDKEKFNNSLSKLNIPMELIQNKEKKEIIEEMRKNNTPYFQMLPFYNLPQYRAKINNMIIITNEMLIEVLLLLLSHNHNIYDKINGVLNEHNSNILISKINIGPKQGQKRDRYKYIIGYVQEIKSINI